MKELTKKILYFILPLLIVWISLFIYFEKYIKHETYKIFEQDEILESAPNKFQYLIGGHSRLGRAINSSQFPSSVKATSAGESPIETYYKLKYILNQTDKEFDTIILPFGLATFKPNDFRRSIYWIKYVDFFEVGYRKGELGLYTSAWAEAKFLPFLSYYKKKIKSLLNNQEKAIKIDKVNGKLSDLKESEKKQFIQKDVDLLNQIGLVDEAAKYYINETILMAKKHNIQIVYIKSPLNKNYAEALKKLDDNKSHDELEKYVKEFSHVNVIDMEAVFWNQDSLFSDHHHLNVSGSKRFTAELLNRLNFHN